MGQQTWQWPNWHGPANIGWKGDYTHTTCIVPVPHSSAEVNYTWQPLPYISPAYFGNAFKYIWYGVYYICLELIFQYKFNDVCFMIGLPYLAIISGMLIWSILYMSRTHFSIRIQQWCLFHDQTTLFGNYFRNAWYEIYHICLGLIFQYEFNGDVCVVIGLPYLVILTNAIIGVSKTTSTYSNMIYLQDLNLNSECQYFICVIC